MPLKPDKPVKVGITTTEIKYIAGHLRLNYNQVLTLIQNILNETLRLCIFDLEMWIDKYVPKRTGQLRENLKLHLQSSDVQKGIMKLILRTDIDYAKFVNDMTTMKVRHSGEIGYAGYGGAGRYVVLNDPQAIGNFFFEFVKYAKERAIINLAKARATYLGGAGTLGRMITSRLGQ